MRAPGPSRAALLFAWAGAALFVISLLYFLYVYLIRFGEPASGPVGRAVALNVLLFSGFALHHSLLARTAMKERMHSVISPSLERSAYTWVASALFLFVCWAWQPVPGTLYMLTGAGTLAGYTLQALGLVVIVKSSARLDVLDLAGIRPVLLHRAGQRPVRPPLETRGLYGLVRHPLYLGWIFLVFGTPQMTMTRFVFAGVSTAYLAIAIPFEERSLIRVFGAAYRDYQHRVRWRMIPGLY